MLLARLPGQRVQGSQLAVGLRLLSTTQQVVSTVSARVQASKRDKNVLVQSLFEKCVSVGVVVAALVTDRESLVGQPCVA